MNLTAVYRAVSLSIVLASGQGAAKDLGTHGPLFEVTEPSLLDTIKQRLSDMEAAGELDVMKKEMQGFPEAIANDGQLEAFAIGDLPKPFITIVEGGMGEISLTSGGMLTADQVLDRIYVIREVPVGERL